MKKQQSVCGNAFRCRLVPLVVLALALGLCYPAKAAPSDRVVRVGYYPVTEYQDKDAEGNYWGFGYDYYQQIQKYVPWQYDFVEASYVDCMQMLIDGEIDVVSGVIPTDARREVMDFSHYSISNTQNKLYARADDATMFYESYDQFNGSVVAIMRGVLTEGLREYARQHGFEITLKEYDSLEEMEDALLSGEVRLLYATSIAATANTKIVARLDKIILNYAVAKDSPEVLRELDDALQKIIDNNPNFYTQMSDKYMVSGANAIATFTKEEYDYIHSGTPVYAVLNENWAPISWYDTKSGCFRGIVTGLLDKISQYSGMQFILCSEAEFAEIAARDPDAANNSLALLSDDTVWAARQSLMTTNRILDASVVQIAKRGAALPEPEKLHYAMPERYYISWKTASMLQPEQITYYPSIRECVDAVNQGKADVTFTNELVASYYLSMLQYSDLYATVSSAFDENIAMAISKDTDRPLLGVLDKSILCISRTEINELVVANSVAEQRITLQGLFYSNPVAFTLVLLLAMAVLGGVLVFVVALASKRRRLAAELRLEQQNATARTEFFMMISHELRTPLNAIVGYLSMAEPLCRPNSPEREYLARSQNAARQLTAVAQDMLDYTQIASSTATLHPRLFDLKTVVYHIGQNTSLEAEKKGIDFRLNVRDIDHEFVIGDELRVTQIMQNVLSNSVKFTAEGGRVEAEVAELTTPEGGLLLRFTARDTGKGMSPDFLKKVCAPFNQSDPSYSRTHGGLGLGLYLTKYYLDAMGGRMEVESTLEQGSSFTVTLPLERAHSEQLLQSNVDYSHVRALLCGPEPENDALRELLKRLHIKSTPVTTAELALRRLKSRQSTGYPFALCVVDESLAVQPGFVAELAAADDALVIFVMTNGELLLDLPQTDRCRVLSKPIFQSVLFDAVITHIGAYVPEKKQELRSFAGVRALVVEDNHVNADILVHLLEKMRIESEVRENGSLAVDAVREQPGRYDIVFMDIQMPVMDGLEAARRIRALPNGGALPILAVSANAFPADIEHSKQAGMNEHLSKPVDAEGLGEAIARWLPQGREEQQGGTQDGR